MLVRWSFATAVLAAGLAACGSSDESAADGAGGGAGGGEAPDAASGPDGAAGGGAGESDAATPGPDAATPGPDAAPAADVTWHRDVEPIVTASCGGCHTPTGIAPFPLETYEQVRAMAPSMLSAIERGVMPPWGAQETEECTPRHAFRDDLRLSPEQVDVLRGWIAAGSPEGDPADAPPPRERSLSTLADATVELEMGSPFVVDGPRDVFRCFVFDPMLMEDAWLTGAHFVAGNPRVAHHALLFLDPEGQSQALAGPDGSYDCFGGANIDGAALLSAWAPGGVPHETPEGSAMKIPAGARVVVQMHYHPRPEGPETDRSRIQLRFTDAAPEYTAATVLIGNFDDADARGGLMPGPNDAGDTPEFRIPAGVAGHVEEMSFTVPGVLDGKPFPGVFLAHVANHMHYLGTDMKMWIERAETRPFCRAEQVAPARECAVTNCDGLAGAAIVSCLEEHCESFLDGFPDECGTCLIRNIGQGVAGAFATCETETLPEPEQYGPLPEQPQEECLLQTPGWDFAWQRFYAYDAPIHELPLVRGGDTLRMRCTFDNSMSNPYLAEALRDQGLDAPVDVRLGEETLDEMCLIGLTIVYKPMP